eukprot:CAMPEP_0172167948 /NCGR_PEP_ID=MMETSP1050-20130122/9857_1 /TAXON_ID=233186 /ORGANISM="Cryptomonas curvata, Strain CCAP979/52" /LENGTH=64 /DNA_ID=CAMNT_0012838799 /DNA_START=499 /DNA_END=690 /DNA_ORIENTATION=-
MLQRQLSTSSVSDFKTALPGERTLHWGTLFEKLSHPDMLLGVSPTFKGNGDSDDKQDPDVAGGR